MTETPRDDAADAPSPAEGGGQSHPRARRLLRGAVLTLATVVVALAGGWLGLTLGGTVHHEVGPLETSMRVTPSWHGGTSVQVPPLGTLDLDTHAGPLGLQARLEGVDATEAKALVADPQRFAGLEPQAESDLRAEVELAAVRALVVSVIGAALSCALVLRRVRAALGGALTALVAVGVSGVLALTSWSPAAIAEPRYTGLLTSAPSVVGNAETIVSNFSVYGDELARLVRNVTGLYAATSNLPLLPRDQNLVRVLHVSDLHLAPQAWDLIQTVSQQYHVDVVVDSGDITDHGTRAENRYLQEIRRLKKPYVWVRGNHDSMVTQRAMSRIPNVHVLDGRIEHVAGLSFLGIGDPSFTPDKSGTSDVDQDDVRRALVGLSQKAQLAGGVDVEVFHDPTDREVVDGTAPMALFGHFHARRVFRGEQGTWLMLQGSTGGSGLRALEPKTPAPIEMSVLYVDRDSGALRAYDDITLGGLGLASARVERHVVDDPTTGSELVGPQPESPKGHPHPGER